MKTKTTLSLTKDLAVFVPVHGPMELLKGEVTLEAAQKMVDGWVEALQFKRDGYDVQALYNEEGLLKDMPLNPRACVFAARRLVGPVIILTGKRRWT